MSSKCIILRKSGGFYQVFDDDALIINYLFDYKINNYKCGFPVKTLDKVIDVLEEKSINYIVKDNVGRIGNFKNRNKYTKYLEKSILKDKINNILNELDNMDNNKLNEVLSMIEKYVYE